MKAAIVFLSLLIFQNFSLASAADPASKESIECVKMQVRSQFPVLTAPLADSVSYWGSDKSNFDYMLLITENSRVTGRVFISVRDANYSNAMIVVENMGLQTIDLSSCF